MFLGARLKRPGCTKQQLVVYQEYLPHGGGACLSHLGKLLEKTAAPATHLMRRSVNQRKYLGHLRLMPHAVHFPFGFGTQHREDFRECQLAFAHSTSQLTSAMHYWLSVGYSHCRRCYLQSPCRARRVESDSCLLWWSPHRLMDARATVIPHSTL